jgi:MFS family permease
MNTLPNVVVQPFAGAIVEKMNKKKVIIITYLLRAIVISAFILLYKLDLVSPVLLAAFTLTITAIESFSLPASTAYTAQVIKKEHMTAGLSLSSIVSRAATLAGTGFAGILIAKAGAGFAMLIDVSTFIIAAILIAVMKKTKKENAVEAVEESVKLATKEGFRYVLQTPAVRNFSLLCILLNFMLVPINALQAPIASDIFKMGSELLSIAGIFSSLGGIFGAAILPFLIKKLSPLKITVFGLGVLTFGIMLLPFGNLINGNALLCYILISASFFIMLTAAAMLGGIINIQFMKTVDHAYMARASAVFNSSATAAMPLGSLLVGAIVGFTGTLNILIFTTVFSALILIFVRITKPTLEMEGELLDAA